jgi:hypothetical protein
MPSGKIDISIINAILKTQFLSYMSTHLTSVSTESEGRFLDITPINVSKEDLESLREFMKSPKASDWVKDNRMKRLASSIASASTSRMGSNTTSRRSAVVPLRLWPQSPSTSRTPTVISLFCVSRTRGSSAHDRI